MDKQVIKIEELELNLDLIGYINGGENAEDNSIEED